MRLGLGLGLSQTANHGLSYPAALGWSSDYAFTARDLGSEYSVSLDPQSLVDPAVWTGTAYYVNPTTGSNANSGLTLGAAVQTIANAITKGQAGGVPFRILPAAGLYPRNRSVVTLAATTPDFAIIPQGGRCVFTTHDALTWTDDASGNNTYTAPRTAVTRVVDMSTLTANGKYTELTKRADADVAGVRANAGSWCQNGANVVVHRADNGVVTDSNVRAYVTSDLLNLSTYATSVYVENVDFEGANGVHIAGGARNTAFVDCSVRYVGSSASLIDGFRIINMDGLFFASGTDASANCKDGFNITTSAGAQVTYGLLVNCTGYENGRFTATSTNGLTAHSAQHIVCDIGGSYASQTEGENIAFVGGSKLWALGTVCGSAAGSRYDILASNSGTAVYLENTTSNDGLSLVASDSAAIYKRRHTSAGTEATLTSGTIGSF